ncbi:hypothetical protein Xen7305DRAFT_00004370 [Xenococcus sp. PCC 7305]|uniref:hypothetical protein n=1 Tax=Xenococcus sp. PCC 7305 TaxID=102125 RepID=UPI0002ACCB8A|nr:hypothetical protein [Xenococcus sp. PCC 7305]ELS00736.1 hypothetical protein Xen7305DRAFT_00004370 [Xenococcus sp. PCC 7305]
MFLTSLLILSISIGAIVSVIHGQDEIHQLVAFLSALIAMICAFILSPLLVKGLLCLVFLSVGHKIFPVHRCFK